MQLSVANFVSSTNMLRKITKFARDSGTGLKGIGIAKGESTHKSAVIIAIFAIWYVLNF